VNSEQEHPLRRRDYGIDLDDRARASSVSSLSSGTLAWVADPVLGVDFALLQVDPFSGLWVTRTRFPPGCTVQKHLHSGAVSAVTIAGSWGYPELNAMCGPGDFLIEQAGTVHSLQVMGDETVDIIFMINGSITYFSESGEVDRIEDWRSVLAEYETGCEERGRRAEVLGLPTVMGESRTRAPLPSVRAE
jgi:2,4'-dihydroxyacetophenone dioxygenase